MTKRNIAIFCVILLIVLGGVGVYGAQRGWFSKQPTVTPNPPADEKPAVDVTDFAKTGNLTKDTPGAEPGTWYLVYEQPGQAALSVKLAFDKSSQCLVASQAISCDDLVAGQRATVTGLEANGTVVASKVVMDKPIPLTDKKDLIQVTSPKIDAVVTSPLTISGKARGQWYFEASFPIKLLDANGEELGRAVAQAQGEWMTTDFVPFSTKLNFQAPTTETGTLVLEKDNPSGLAQNADELRIPVKFSTQVIKLYYYNSSLDQDSTGNVQCTRKGLVYVGRVIPKTLTPIQDSIRELLKGNLTAAEKAQGVTTEFPLAGVELKGATLKDGKLTLEFADPQNKTSGGSCRAGILWYQIEATAKQFPEVKTVEFKPTTLFQP